MGDGSGVRVESGNCLEVMRRLAEGGVQVDAIVTDPPYHLTSAVAMNRSAFPGRYAGTGGQSRGFMGKAWDGGDVAFNSVTWGTAASLLKPGGYLLAFGGTRNYHKLGWAIEGGGFDVRDCIAWLYGSGFPKSHDVSKALDKARTEDLEPVRRVCRFLRAAMDERGFKSRHLTSHFDDCHPRLIDHWAARDSDSQPSLPTWEQWLKLKDVLSLSAEMDAEVWRLNQRKGQPGDAFADAEITGAYEGDPGGLGGERFTFADGLKRIPNSDKAAQWEGWGTALKPALEPICVARKPLGEKTVAANVLRYGTGALNVDGCRVEGPKTAAPQGQFGGSQIGPTGHNGYRDGSADKLGRWPANVCHDGSPEVEAAFAAFGNQGGGYGVNTGKPANVYGNYAGLGGEQIGYGDSGTASRFFYTAKADAHDRWGSKHPTVKPIDLMRWLVRLVTPPGGTVLDPFAGSGTTGIAAMAEGFDCILIEREEEYLADIRERLAFYEGEGRHSLAAKNRQREQGHDDLPLFAVE